MPPRPHQLRLKKTIAFVHVPHGQTFFYKKRVSKVCDGHLQVITTGHEDVARFRRTPGPFIYAVADHEGNTRYIGKSLEAFLYKRWIRIKGNIHHKESRDHIIEELLASRGPLWLWSASIEELRRHLPPAWHGADARALAVNLEGLWIDRWKPHLWNKRDEPFDLRFDDGQFWARL